MSALRGTTTPYWGEYSSRFLGSLTSGSSCATRRIGGEGTKWRGPEILGAAIPLHRDMNEITVNELAALTNPMLVDVREPDEFAAGHAVGAVNIPLGQVESRLSELPADGTVHVICQSGARSARATAMLTGHGVDAVNVLGGTTAWIRSGLPTDEATSAEEQAA